jgi:DNA-binding GntR family transcriptional regulator
MWRWRTLGLAHPQRSAARSQESIDNLRAIVDVIRDGDGERAERMTREEANQAAAEVLRLLAVSDLDDTNPMTELQERHA